MTATHSPFAAPVADVSPVTIARITGVLFLLTIVLGVMGQSIEDRLVVTGDAGATAASLTSHAALWRWSLACYLMEMATGAATTALFYGLLRPVGRHLALVAAFLSLAGIVMKTMSRLFHVMPLVVLGGSASFGAFSGEQQGALAMLLIAVNVQGSGMALVPLGLSAVLNGFLVMRSTFLPRVLGVLSLVAGAGWLAYLYRPFADRAAIWIIGMGLVASVVKIGWLIAIGVHEGKWRASANRSAASIWA